MIWLGSDKKAKTLGDDVGFHKKGHSKFSPILPQQMNERREEQPSNTGEMLIRRTRWTVSIVTIFVVVQTTPSLTIFVVITPNSVENPKLICNGKASIFRTRTWDGLRVNVEKNFCKSQAADGPAHGYGFDRNPAAVAKAKLILALLVYDVPVHNAPAVN